MKLKQFGHIVNDKALYSIAAIFVFMIMIVGVEYFITTQKVSDSTVMREELFKKYSLKPTMMQNKSMLKEYKSIHAQQKKLREYVAVLLSLNLKSTVKVSLINLKANTLIVEFRGVPKGKEPSLEKTFDAKKMNYTSSFKEKIWHLEFKI